MRAAHDSHAPRSALLERADAYEPISVFVLDVVHRIVPLVAKDNAPRIRSTFRAAQRLAIGLHPGRQHLLAGFNAQAEERMAHLAARLPSAATSELSHCRRSLPASGSSCETSSRWFLSLLG